MPQYHVSERLSLSSVPALDISEFRQVVITRVSEGEHLMALFCSPAGDNSFYLYAVLGSERCSLLTFLRTEVKEVYPALTPECACAHMFEREIAEQWAIKPEGHPWLKPVRFHPAYISGRDVWGRTPDKILPGVMKFFEMTGDEIHEVAVGPVHAGIIEPGHFRFQCHGEHVYHLEISLGYQHRGVERALVRGPDKRTIHYVETMAGDTSIGHATAYSQVYETLSNTTISARAYVLRAIALELERLANHTGDIGALAGDVAYLPTASYCGRIRGDFLNMTALLCGNRFGRGFVLPGGVAFDADKRIVSDLLKRLGRAEKDITVAVELLWKTPSVMSRFERTGTVSRDVAEELGLVGPVARASGISNDVRRDFPIEASRAYLIPVAVRESGDVSARTYIRWHEIKNSIHFVRQALKELPQGETLVGVSKLTPDSMATSLIEGWRGRICHVALTDGQGLFSRYKVIDPSFLNWKGLSMALRDQQISDFPLCNKSFNLSYCGHDL